jgi:hypothetical protein
MTKLMYRVPGGEAPLLDLVSYGRGGPASQLTPTQVEHIRRTVRRVPEVMVKVLSSGGQDLKSVGKHIDYIDRHGKLPLETDDGDRLSGQASKTLLADWDLDLEDKRRRNDLSPTNARRPPKLVYKIMFSMPEGTPPDKVREAVCNFAREEFALQHRYAFVLHTDEPHPHVHMIVKALSEQGTRLNIRKATLRHWRSEFARHLRAFGVEANATERAVRGENRKAKKDGIYRAGLRGDSRHLRKRVEAVASDLLKGNTAVEPGKGKLMETRKAVERGWHDLAHRLANGGNYDLARDIERFVERMEPAITERQAIKNELVRPARQLRVRDHALSR